MFAPLTLGLALTAAVQAAPAATGVEFIARTTDVNGRTTVASVFTITGDLRIPHSRFVYAPKSVCDGLLVSTQEPARSAYGWRIFVSPVTYDAGSRVPVRADLLLTTLRMWNASGPVPDAPTYKGLPTPSEERTAVIDTLPALRQTAGCTASSLSLEARLLGAPPAARAQEKLVEAELWFVHKAPDGKETSERQVVRMRDGGRGDFYFDDMNLTLKTEMQTLNIAVEVFGTLHTGTVDRHGDINLTLYLTRRYINNSKGLTFGKYPKTGKTEYPTTVKAGEVVSFILPPLADDDGILLGHRFSVRLRLKPVGSGEVAAELTSPAR